MKMEKNTKADSHDHNNHLPKDVLNLEQDKNSFTDPLVQQLEKQKTNNTAENNEGQRETPEE